jgi:outer membrane protein OmpA-like peptidoglycan-associated protein
MAEKVHANPTAHAHDSELRPEAAEPHASANEPELQFEQDWLPLGIAFQPRRLLQLGDEARAQAVLNLQRAIGNRAVQRSIARSHSTESSDDLARRIQSASSGGSALDAATRDRLEPGLGVDLSSVRIHTDAEADHLSRSVEAIAFTAGQDIFFRGGAYDPSSSQGLHLLAHEATHVVQQSAGPVAGTPAPGGVSISDPSDRFEQEADRVAAEMMNRPAAGVTAPAPGTTGQAAQSLQRVQDDEEEIQTKPLNSSTPPPGMRYIQRSLIGTYPVTSGGFEIDMETRQGAVNTPPTHSGLDGYIRFVPNPTAPNSNQIVMIQIVKLTNVAHADVNPASLPAAQAPRGALGQSGLRTQDDPLRGVEGGYFTDVHHQPSAAGPATPQGSALSPRYNFQPAAPGTTGTVGQTAQLPQYGGGIGGVVGQTPGFKRSNNPADIRSAAMYDTPGVADPSWNLDFGFETVAQGEDTMITYGSVKWGFALRAGLVSNEHITVQDTQSATFDEALERHRDFYVHEPVTFYFDFNSDRLNPGEAAKIDTFTAYLTRNTDVHMSLEGFADIRGGASVKNAELSLRRALAVKAALLAKGIAENRIEGVIVGSGASTAATTDAGTGDQGGSAAVGADQTREANRWANRRVVLTFRHVPAATPATGSTP